MTPETPAIEFTEEKPSAERAVPPKLPTLVDLPHQAGETSHDRLNVDSLPSSVATLPAKKRFTLRRALKWIGLALAFCIVFPILQVALLRFVDPPFSTMMVYQSVVNLFSGKSILWKHTNVNKNQVAPQLYSSILAGEDQRFYLHHGFDFDQIRDAERAHARHPNRPMRGASTISQQTAKNLFLPPWHSFIRKGIEAYYTVLMEWMWPKDRILEMYGNIAEFGPGVYGAEAGAEYHFKRHAKDLTAQQAAQMAAVLPNPERWSASRPSPYIQRRAARLLRQMHGIPTNGDDDDGDPD